MEGCHQLRAEVEHLAAMHADDAFFLRVEVEDPFKTGDVLSLAHSLMPGQKAEGLDLAEELGVANFPTILVRT